MARSENALKAMSAIALLVGAASTNEAIAATFSATNARTEITELDIAQATAASRCVTSNGLTQPPPVDHDCGSMHTHLFASVDSGTKDSDEFRV